MQTITCNKCGRKLTRGEAFNLYIYPPYTPETKEGRLSYQLCENDIAEFIHTTKPND